jgi:DNA-binding transcriptional LysR family regulator
MDRLHSMRVFARVIDEGSFAAAARSLNVSAAVVTRLVADLEAHLGARLIHRSTRRLALTDTGAAYLERVRAILSDVEEADALAIATVSEPKGHLRVRVPSAFAVHQLARHLPAFHKLCPQVTVALTAEAGFVDVADEGLRRIHPHLQRRTAKRRLRGAPPRVERSGGLCLAGISRQQGSPQPSRGLAQAPVPGLELVGCSARVALPAGDAVAPLI